MNALSAYVVAASLGTALETGLPWLLAEQPLDAAGVAQTLEIPLNRCRYLLQLLSEEGLLVRTPAGYATSAAAREAILNVYSREAWAYLAREELAKLPSMIDLTRRMHERGRRAAPPGYIEKMRNDPAHARDFTRMLYELHRVLADRLAEHIDLAGVHRLLDVGGGSGVVSLRLLRQYPELSATVADLDNVCTAGREIARENGLEERIAYQAVDFLLVIVEGFALEDGEAVSWWRLYWSFQESLHDPEADFPTLSRAKAMLSRAGFAEIAERAVPGSWRGIVEARRV